MVINEAEAKQNATLVTNKAQMEAFLQVTQIESEAYGAMKRDFKMTDEEFLKYIRVKTINQFNQKNLLIGVSPVIEIKDAASHAASTNSESSDAESNPANSKLKD